MSLLKLTIATTDYDHFRDFRLVVVKAEGIDHNWLNLGHHECFARFTASYTGANVGRWSIQQVVIHLADAEAAFADRIRRLIAEDDAILHAWDENAFVQRLFYERQSATDAAEMIRLTRNQTARILRAAGDGCLTRKGTHTERGPVTLAEALAHANAHLDHHVKFIHDKRAHMGKEMW